MTDDVITFTDQSETHSGKPCSANINYNQTLHSMHSLYLYQNVTSSGYISALVNNQTVMTYVQTNDSVGQFRLENNATISLFDIQNITFVKETPPVPPPTTLYV